MAKYKVGDKVRVRSDLKVGRDYNGITLLDGSMFKCVGQIGKILDITDIDDYVSYRIDSNAFTWSEEMLEPVGGNNMAKFNICRPTDLVLYVQGDISPASLRPANPDTSTLKNLVATISRSERYESLGKHKGKAIPQITTTITVDGRSASATCDEADYSERQGVLEALANLIYGDFDKAYNKMKKDEARAYAASCKCKVCGKTYDTPDEARACEKAHADRKKAKAEKWAMYRAAKKRARELEVERMAQEMVKKK